VDNGRGGAAPHAGRRGGGATRGKDEKGFNTFREDEEKKEHNTPNT